jgi:hypothetical protein
MKLSKLYPSKYLRADDLGDGTRTVVIESLELEEMSDGQEKPVLYFKGMAQGLVLNRTNSYSLAEVYGDETDDWVGQRIQLYVASTEYRGQRVPCIRVRASGRTHEIGADDSGDEGLSVTERLKATAARAERQQRRRLHRDDDEWAVDAAE